MALLPAYSDEIAQDFHLLLFYPFLCFGLLQRKRHLKFPYSVLFRNACIPALLPV